MKKRKILALITIIFAVCIALCLTACIGDDEERNNGSHEHVFDQHNTEAKYRKSFATCTQPALYYYSCTCGEKGENVFINGKSLGHTGGTATCVDLATCERCGEQYGKIASGNHNFIDGACSRCDVLQTTGLDYTLSADKTYYSVSKGRCKYETIHIAASYKGKPVKRIDKNGFANQTALKNITIPDSITEIGESAFSGCYYLTGITIPDSVTTIGNSAFNNCRALKFANLSHSVTSIGGGVFQNCSSLMKISIPNSVNSIGNVAFQGCTRLEKVSIPNSVTSIGSEAFKFCTHLPSITIPDSVVNMSNNVFLGCSKLKSVTIGSGLTTIGDNVFSDCEALSSVIIPISVTTINDNAFIRCNSLANVYYKGSAEDWSDVSIGNIGNDSLINATVHYNYVPEE